MGNGDVLVRLDKEEMERLLIRYVNELDLEFHPNALEHLKSRVNIGAIEKAITMKKVKPEDVKKLIEKFSNDLYEVASEKQSKVITSKIVDGALAKRKNNCPFWLPNIL